MAQPSGPVRVFVVDDHEVVRRGVAALLAADPRTVLAGEAAGAAEALVRIAAARPDVAVLDARLADGSGIELCREVRSRHPSVACVILTAFDDDAAVLDAERAGAAGTLLKQVRGASLVDALVTAAAGGSLLDGATRPRAAERVRAADAVDPVLATLTPREREVLGLVAAGLSNRQVGERLGLAEKTVKNHVSALLAKLGMQRRTQAAVYGARVGPTAG